MSVKANVADEDLVRSRQAHIVKAALKVFQRKGYHGATVRDIGREAKLTQGTLYNYITSKDDILYLVCRQTITAYNTAIMAATDGIDDPKEKLLRAIQATTESVWDQQENILLVYQEAHSLDRRHRAAIKELAGVLISTFDELLDELSRQRSLPRISRPVLTNILTFLPAMIALRRWELKGRASRDEIINGVVAFLQHGLLCSSEGASSQHRRARDRIKMEQ